MDRHALRFRARSWAPRTSARRCRARHRRQPRSFRRVAISRPEPPPNCAPRQISTAYRCTGTAPDPPPRRSTSTDCPITPPIMRRLPPKSAASKPVPACRAVRLPLDPLARPAIIRRRIAGFQHRHQQWRLAAPPEVEAIVTNACADAEPTATTMSSMAASAAAGSPAITAIRKRRPCRADGTGQARLPAERSAALEPYDPAKAEQLRAVLKPMLRRLASGPPALTAPSFKDQQP